MMMLNPQKLLQDLHGPDEPTWRRNKRLSRNDNVAAVKEKKHAFDWGYATEEFPNQMTLRFPMMSEQVRHDWCDPNNKTSPFSKFIGNRDAVDRLADAAFAALANPSHECSEVAWALFGQPSTGKTTLAKIFAKVLCLPFVEISAGACKSVDYILKQINTVLTEKHGFPLVFVEREGHFKIPPLVLFIDEVHDLSNDVVQGLLKATEFNDAQLQTPNGFSADCKHITWMIGTTDSGDLFDAFRTRFTGQIQLSMYSYNEIAQIVKLNNKDWSDDVCQLVAKNSDRVARTALGFAREMRLAAIRNREASWTEVANLVAKRNNIDDHGMNKQRLSVLIALGKNGPMSMRNLGYQAGVNCKERELARFLLPPMLTSTSDLGRMVKIDSRGVGLTNAGISELTKRGITADYYKDGEVNDN